MWHGLSIYEDLYNSVTCEDCNRSQRSLFLLTRQGHKLCNVGATSAIAIFWSKTPILSQPTVNCERRAISRISDRDLTVDLQNSKLDEHNHDFTVINSHQSNVRATLRDANTLDAADDYFSLLQKGHQICNWKNVEIKSTYLHTSAYSRHTLRKKKLTGSKDEEDTCYLLNQHVIIVVTQSTEISWRSF